MTLKKLAARALYGLLMLFLLWMAFSWLDTICHNAMPNPQYSPINFFAMVIRGCPR